MAVGIDGNGNKTHYPRPDADAKPSSPIWGIKLKDGKWQVEYEPLTPEVVPEAVNPNAPVFTTVNEQDRTYTFPNGKVTIEGVVDINVSKSGTHRINTKDGLKHIIPSGWLHIAFNADKWTF